MIASEMPTDGLEPSSWPKPPHRHAGDATWRWPRWRRVLRLTVALIGIGWGWSPIVLAVPPQGDSAVATPPAQDPLGSWKKPRVALFLTGRQFGYMEPCGCTGLANQKGGLARRFSLLTSLEQERGWTILPLDVGNQVRRSGRQAEIQFSTTIEALRKMNYGAVGFGPEDLSLSFDELLVVAAGAATPGEPFVCANVRLLDFNPKYRILERAGIRFGITAVLGDRHAAQVVSQDIEKLPVAKALPPVVAEMRAQRCDVMILLAHATEEETEQLARAHPEFQLIVTSAGAGEPAHEIQHVTGARGGIIQVGTKGMHVGVVGIYGEPAKFEVLYARVPLDARYPDAPAMLDSLAGYQQQLKALGLQGLQVQSVAHPSERPFVGSERCADCHEKEYAIWEGSPHAHATESLYHPRERSHIPRHHDPECLSCHVTGWNPQEFFPYQTGYVDYEKSRALHGNGCENCHGPGGNHVAAENGDVEVDEAQKKVLQRQMHVSLSAEQCMTCHDLDNSPDFHTEGALQKYWEKIAHGQE